MSVFRERILRSHLCKARRVFEGHNVAKSLLNSHFFGLIAIVCPEITKLLWKPQNGLKEVAL